jgi:hypothetical protein
MTNQHEATYCNIKGCKDEATRWLDVAGIPGLKMPDDTFYLCEQHQSALSPEDEVVRFPVVKHGEMHIEDIELAVYSCSDTCGFCN